MVTWLLSFLPLEWLAGIGVAIAALVATWFGGRKAAKSDAKIKDLKSEIQAHEARNDAEDAAAADPDPRERLRERWRRQ